MFENKLLFFPAFCGIQCQQMQEVTVGVTAEALANVLWAMCGVDRREWGYGT
jgi:hypothetical protein